MAPKTPLLTAGTTDFTKKRAPRHALTTASKVAKAAAQAEKNRKKVLREPSADPKPRSLPPPGEMLIPPKSKVPESRKSRYAKPLTTTQKVRAAEAMSKAKGTGSAKPAAAVMKVTTATDRNGISGGERKVTKVSKVKPPGMMAVLRTHDATSVVFEGRKDGRNGVMNRRTQRSERYASQRREKALRDPEVCALWMSGEVQGLVKRSQGDVGRAVQELRGSRKGELAEKVEKLIEAGVLPAPALEIGVVDLKTGKEEGFRLMDLPKELRLEIFALVVVEMKVFIRPDSLTGREQPDLAMVSRQVRREVLPLFYGKNTFAIDLAPPPQTTKKVSGKTPLSGLPAVEKWAKVLEKGGWFGKIRKWAFDWSPPVAWIIANSTGVLRNVTEGSSLTVHVRFSKNRKHSQPGTWCTVVEVHREAPCIMPGFEEYDMCVAKRTPEWLNEAVLAVTNDAEGSSIGAEMMLNLARKVKSRVSELLESRCEKVARSIESDT